MSIIKIFVAAIAIGIVSCAPYKCSTVTEVLACNPERCRVQLSNGERATVIGITAVGDSVYKAGRRFWHVAHLNNECIK